MGMKKSGEHRSFFVRFYNAVFAKRIGWGIGRRGSAVENEFINIKNAIK